MDQGRILSIDPLLFYFQVSSNGFFTFDGKVSYTSPRLFSPSSSSYMVAPFWANSDISMRVGSVSYEVHSSQASSDYIDLVNSFISRQQQVQFNGTWMILAEWKDVPKYNGSLDDVSIELQSRVRIFICNIGCRLTTFKDFL